MTVDIKHLPFIEKKLQDAFRGLSNGMAEGYDNYEDVILACSQIHLFGNENKCMYKIYPDSYYFRWINFKTGKDYSGLKHCLFSDYKPEIKFGNMRDCLELRFAQLNHGKLGVKWENKIDELVKTNSINKTPLFRYLYDNHKKGSIIFPHIEQYEYLIKDELENKTIKL